MGLSHASRLVGSLLNAPDLDLIAEIFAAGVLAIVVRRFPRLVNRFDLERLLENFVLGQLTLSRFP